MLSLLSPPYTPSPPFTTTTHTISNDYFTLLAKPCLQDGANHAKPFQKSLKQPEAGKVRRNLEEIRYVFYSYKQVQFLLEFFIVMFLRDQRQAFLPGTTTPVPHVDPVPPHS